MNIISNNTNKMDNILKLNEKNPFHPDILRLEKFNTLIYVSKNREIRVHKLVSNTELLLHELIKNCKTLYNQKFFFKMDKIYYFNNTILLLRYFDKTNDIKSYIGFNLETESVVKVNQTEFEKFF